MNIIEIDDAAVVDLLFERIDDSIPMEIWEPVVQGVNGPIITALDWIEQGRATFESIDSGMPERKDNEATYP